MRSAGLRAAAVCGGDGKNEPLIERDTGFGQQWLQHSAQCAFGLADHPGAGLVARVRDEGDRRRNVVTLTRVGRSALARLDKRIDAAQEALLEPLSGVERQELRRLLHKILESR
jgi:hypothetical protein